jgi:predicted RNase H-like HicB family nuclease
MEHYLALFEPDLETGGYVVTFPDFGYGVTQGETDREAMEMAQDLLMLTIGDYIRERKRLPVPARRRGSKFRPVPLPVLQAAKVKLLLCICGFRFDENRVCPPHRHTEDTYRTAALVTAPLEARSDRGCIRRARQTPGNRSPGCRVRLRVLQR